MIRAPAFLVALLACGAVHAQIIFGGSLTPAGTSGQTQYNNAGQLGAYSLTGDCSFAVTVGTVVCGAPYLETQTFIASAGANPSIIIPQGSTPSGTPPNGSIWNTSAGMFVQIAGATVGPLTSSAASGCTVSGTVGQLVYNSGSSGCLSSTGTISAGGLITLLNLDFLSTTGACTASVNGIHLTAANTVTVCINGSSGGAFTSGFLTLPNSLQVAATGNISFNSRGILTSSAAGNMQLGSTDAAAPVAQTLSAQSVVAGTSNTAGVDAIIQGSRGTGTGVGGAIIVKTAPAGSAGTPTVQNAATQAGKFDTTQYFIPGGTAQPTCGTGCASIAAGATDQRMLVTTSTAVTSIAVNFSGTKTTAPICTASEIAGTPLAIGFNAAPSTSSFTLTAASALTATVIAVTCL